MEPLYPISIYVYNEDGTHGEPILILSESQLHGPGTILLLQDAMRRKVEIIMTDPGDCCLFQAKDGKIYFDGAKRYSDGREPYEPAR